MTEVVCKMAKPDNISNGNAALQLVSWRTCLAFELIERLASLLQAFQVGPHHILCAVNFILDPANARVLLASARATLGLGVNRRVIRSVS